MISLLQLLKRHEPAVEASLQAVYGIDYRDRWRNPKDLTLRRLHALVTNLPPESALARELSSNPEWTLEAHLLDTIRMALTSTEKKPAKPWPGRFKPNKPDADQRSAALRAAEKRRLERERKIAAGEIT